MIIFANQNIREMERIKLHEKYFKPFISYDKIEEAVAKVAEKINNDYSPEEHPIILSVLNGSFMFTASLVQKFNFKPEISFIKVSSYDGVSSTGNVKQVIGLNQDVKGKKILLVEDIVDSGNTIIALHEILSKAGAAEIKVATLFIKPESYKGNIKIDYPAMEIGNEFIVGYGLDYNQLGRNYKDIYIISED